MEDDEAAAGAMVILSMELIKLLVLDEEFMTGFLVVAGAAATGMPEPVSEVTLALLLVAPPPPPSELLKGSKLGGGAETGAGA